MRGPPRPQPTRHHSLDEVRRLLVAAGEAVASAEDAFRRRPGSAAYAQRLFAAEQSLLLVRPAADCGARRGRLAVLRLSDLDGRVLTIERSLSALPWPDQVGQDPEGDPRVGYGRHDPAPLPGLGCPGGAGGGLDAARRYGGWPT